ncbi:MULTISPECIES: YgjV family protein [Shewanella]|uniref:YgjV family protein n=2 Tax=Shewanella TaxID=22 RepID=A0A974XJ85_9GAMM|nr:MULTISPECIES: YgjV family protein [Shewanella]QSX29374.1 YgjV family protein [Shewanella cyperi]QSX36529.1 YgjV family protein [Shewanella sedimentimangrovi]QSX40126.1 YgjV family protein [Shewanella cyperi]
MDNATVWEWVGYLASVVVAISLMMANIKKLRWWNLLGAALFVAYGLAIAAYPVALVNFFIVLIDAYYLVKLYKAPVIEES